MQLQSVFLIFLIALCAAPVAVHAGAFCYFEQIPGGLSADPVCLSDGPTSDSSSMKFMLWNPSTNSKQP
jgi:hypothetical protein